MITLAPAVTADGPPPELDAARAIELMIEIVQEHGADFVYKRWPTSPSCRYVGADDQPDCLIGKILHRHGWSTEDLARHEGTSAGKLPGITFEARQILAVAQGAQDLGATWGRALFYAACAALPCVDGDLYNKVMAVINGENNKDGE